MARIHTLAFRHAASTYSARRYPLKRLYERYYQTRADSRARQRRLGLALKTAFDTLVKGHSQGR